MLARDRVLGVQRVTLETSPMREPRVLELAAELAGADFGEPILEAFAGFVRERQIVRIGAALQLLRRSRVGLALLDVRARRLRRGRFRNVRRRLGRRVWLRKLCASARDDERRQRD